MEIGTMRVQRILRVFFGRRRLDRRRGLYDPGYVASLAVFVYSAWRRPRYHRSTPSFFVKVWRRGRTAGS